MGAFPPFVYRVNTPDGSTISIALAPLEKTSLVQSVAIDNSGLNGIIGLISGPTLPINPAYVIATNTATPVNFPSAVSNIKSVAINNVGSTALVGGDVFLASSYNAKAYFVNTSTQNATEIPNLATNAQILSVAIDAKGDIGLLGGRFVGGKGPLAYIVDNSGSTPSATQLQLSSSGSIYSVAIQDTGTLGVLGGSDNSNNPTAFLVNISNNTVVQLNLGSTSGGIYSIAFDQIVSLLNSPLPTSGLEGNNLRLANYFNAYASDTFFYLFPSVLDGNLSDALKSVAPTRNASSLFASNNNLIAMRESISRRAIVARQSALKNECEFASCGNICLDPHTFWMDIIGLDTYAHAQEQTPRFHPLSIGFVLGYDVLKTSTFRIGGSLAYMYTHLSQGNHGDHNTINQEYVSLYGLWEKCSFYANAALWYGMFQINSLRDMHMTSFDFRAKSYRTGSQLDPYFELGYDYQFNESYLLEPFVMFDWIHTWANAFKENSDSIFKFVQHPIHASMFRTEMGLRFYETFRFCSWNLILEELASYVYRKPHKIGHVKGFLVGHDGTLVLETFTDAQNLGSVGFLMIFESNDSTFPTGTLGYKGEFGSGYQSHQITLGFDWSF